MGSAFALNINSYWDNKKDEKKYIEWTRKFWKSMLPYSTGGAYINFN